jgi:hypothetical protein
LGFADAGFGVAVDSSSNAYIVGTTSSTDFRMTSPIPNGFQTIFPAGNTKWTSFLTRIDTTKSGGASLIYSTYIGGEVFDFGIAIALGPSNVAYATGATSSLLFPTTTGAFQTTGHANGVAFVSLVDTGKTGVASLKYSTFLGGLSGNSGNAIRADGTGNAYVGGATGSADFPVTPGAFEPVLPGVRFVIFHIFWRKRDKPGTGIGNCHRRGRPSQYIHYGPNFLHGSHFPDFPFDRVSEDFEWHIGCIHCEADADTDAGGFADGS